MLIIRKEQREAFRLAALDDLRWRIVDHVRRFFAREIRGLDEAALLELATHVIERAEAYEITKELEVAQFAGVVCLFGRDCEEIAWIEEILSDEGANDPRSKTDRLLLACKAHIREARGLEGASSADGK